MSKHDELMRAIGQLEGKMDGLQTSHKLVVGEVQQLGLRMRSVEMVGARNGAWSGAVSALVVATGVAFIKTKFFGG